MSHLVIAEIAEAKLVVRPPSGASYVFALSDVTTIGRGSDCALVLDDDYCSRHHARIERRDTGYVLADEGSTNGTFVGGEKLAWPHLLAHGDEVQIGLTNLVFIREQGDDETKALEFSPTRGGAALHVDPEKWEVTLGGKNLDRPLSALEFRLLSYLYRHASEVCSREALGRELWGEGKYTFEMLHQLVHRLKERIEPDPRKPRLILTVRAAGYKLNLG